MLATIKSDAEIRELLHEATAELAMFTAGEFGGDTEFSRGCTRYLTAAIQTLRWAVGDASSPIHGVTQISDELVAGELRSARAILNEEPDAVTGLDEDHTTAVYRTLRWLRGDGLIHPLEYV